MEDQLVTPYDENSPQLRFLRLGSIFIVAIFVIVVSIISVVSGFQSDIRFTYGLLGIALLLYALSTFGLWWRIKSGLIDESAYIPVYLQMVILIFMGSCILYGVINTKENTFALESETCYEEEEWCLVYYTSVNDPNQSPSYSCVQGFRIGNSSQYQCVFSPTISTSMEELDVQFDDTFEYDTEDVEQNDNVEQNENVEQNDNVLPSKSSLNKKLSQFMPKVKHHPIFDYPAMNNQEVVKEEEEITKQARRFARAMKAPLIYCSTSHSINVQKIFKIVLSSIRS